MVEGLLRVISNTQKKYKKQFKLPKPIIALVLKKYLIQNVVI